MKNLRYGGKRWSVKRKLRTRKLRTVVPLQMKSGKR